MDGIDRASAVLAPLYMDGGELHVVLTRRTWNLRSHRARSASPADARTTARTSDTALREAQEEVALDPVGGDLGELDHLATITSRSFIVPYVGALAGRPDPWPARSRPRCSTYGSPSCSIRRSSVRNAGLPGGRDRRIFFFEIVGDTIWGATGAMLRQLLGFPTGTVTRGQLDHI